MRDCLRVRVRSTQKSLFWSRGLIEPPNVEKCAMDHKSGALV